MTARSILVVSFFHDLWLSCRYGADPHPETRFGQPLWIISFRTVYIIFHHSHVFTKIFNFPRARSQVDP
ncbi:MAG TPA: hypothetical protein DD706_21045 [Nitrospiraceae bacterium]|nr:hypothetical protein [Nitrospiraceae bacterium]